MTYFFSRKLIISIYSVILKANYRPLTTKRLCKLYKIIITTIHYNYTIRRILILLNSFHILLIKHDCNMIVTPNASDMAAAKRKSLHFVHTGSRRKILVYLPEKGEFGQDGRNGRTRKMGRGQPSIYKKRWRAYKSPSTSS